MKKETVEILKETKYNELNKFHFGIGAYIRNEFLQKDGDLYKYFKSIGAKNADEMSAVLIQYLYVCLKNK